jgi:hypothetical protein
MRYLIILTVTLITSLVSSGQTVTRLDNETAEMFAKRLIPGAAKLAHPVIETNGWGTGAKAIVAFYGYDDARDPNTSFNKILGHLYFPVGENSYRDILLSPIEEDGGYPEILSVFFANADKDETKELIVLCKIEQRHYDMSGAFYETFIFDNPNEAKQLNYLDKLSAKFRGCECGWRDGKTEVAKYKTAKEIKAGLVKMGFKQ